MNKKDKFVDFFAVGGLITLFICIFFGSGIVGIFAWPFVINTWLVFFGKAATVVWWQGFILGMIPAFGQLSLPGAAITWILMLFL